MQLFLLTTIVVAAAMGAMALGVLRGGPALRRGCGHPITECAGCPHPPTGACPREETRWNDG